MSKPFVDVKDVFGLVVFHCSVEVSKRVESYSSNARVLNLLSNPISLEAEVLPKPVQLTVSKHF